MGVVYEAEHESLKSRVALKVMHPRFRADPKYVRRFHAEARLAAGLHHTNIVSVFDYGDQDGVCYYAMQFIQGQPLDRVLADIRRLRDDDTHANRPDGADEIVTIPDRPPRSRPRPPSKDCLTGRFASPTERSPRPRRPARALRRPSRTLRGSGIVSTSRWSARWNSRAGRNLAGRSEAGRARRR